jgi:uncharacterized protein YjbJ (UPF0337 family)
MPHKDEVKGKAKEVVGKVEQGVGRATGDEETTAAGEAREVEGKGQGLVGKVKQKAHDVID